MVRKLVRMISDFLQCYDGHRKEKKDMRKFEGFQRGVNLGGWLSQADETTKEHYDTFITDKDIRDIADMGIDHVRLPVDYTLIETPDGEAIEEGFRYIDQAVKWTRDAGLHLLLDMHNTHGYTFDPLEKEQDKERFFFDEALQERFYRMWDGIARRYASCCDTVAFELLNEVVSPRVAEAWNEIADRAVDVIRAHAPKAYIVIGGVRYNNVTSVPMLRKPKDDHIVYNFHCYEPLIFTHQRAYWVDNMPADITVHWPCTVEEYIQQSSLLQGALAEAINHLPADTKGSQLFEGLFVPAVEAAEKNNAPLYCGEYGVIDQAPAEDALAWLRDIHAVFEKYQIGRALWNYKAKDFGFTDQRLDGVREELIRNL